MGEAQKVGKEGEKLARAYLEAKGYRILEQNVKLRRGEIDLVAEEGGDLVFIEVKTRRSKAFGLPLEAITPTKKRHLAHAVREYLGSQIDRRIRYDVVAILLSPPGPPQIELVQHALVFDERG